MISVLINGICGQMGRAVFAACQAQSGAFSTAAGVDLSDCSAQLSCPVYRDIDDVKEAVDVVIDFSVPASVPTVLRFAQARGIPAIIGTTGLGERELKLIRAASERIPVFQTGNMSLGVNLQLELVRQAAVTLGSNFDVEIVETHHRKKVDAPSGTALMLADAVSSSSPDEMELEFGRHEKNKRRTQNEIGIHSLRGGTVVGEHEVKFIGNDEIVEITHRAFSKQIFAQGALRAAQYIVGKSSGLYSMRNVVSEHDAASSLLSLEDQAVVSVIASASDDSFLSSLFEAVAARDVFVDMIASGEPGEHLSIGFSLAGGELCQAMEALNELKNAGADFAFRTRSDLTKLTLENSGMALRHGVAAQLLSALSKANIHVWLITTSETRIEFCVDAVDAHKAVEEVKQKFGIR
ncbi:MAG: 4-hydroxy-tetrahydrodipicolinate reductase [Clostridiaceae bacterium]